VIEKSLGEIGARHSMKRDDIINPGQRIFVRVSLLAPPPLFHREHDMTGSFGH